jgi:uncharacterized protein (UPF0332 family)
MKTEDLFKERLLRKIKPSLEKASSSLKIAENKLNEAKKLFKSHFFNQTVISAYTCMFHAARAILYKEGIQEKSHYAVCFYLREKYSEKIPKNLLNSFDNYRKERHEALYGFDYEAEKEDAESAIEDSEELLNKIKEILHAKL